MPAAGGGGGGGGIGGGGVVSPRYPLHLHAVDVRDHGMTGDRGVKGVGDETGVSSSSSSCSTSGFSVAAACVDVLGFLSGPVFGGSPVYLVGYGVGGVIASAVAMAAPHGVRGVTVINANVVRPGSVGLSPAAKYFLRLGRKEGEVAEMLAGGSVPSSDELNAQADKRLKECGSFDKMNEELREVFPDRKERMVMLSNIKETNGELAWKMNVGNITRFAVTDFLANEKSGEGTRTTENGKKIDDELSVGSLLLNASKKSNVPFHWIRDQDGGFESRNALENFFSDAKVEDWTNFGGADATHRLLLPRAADVLHSVLNRFDLLSVEEKDDDVADK